MTSQSWMTAFAIMTAGVLWPGMAARGGAAGPASLARTRPPVAHAQTNRPGGATAVVTAERALLNRYCVTCHNVRRPTPAGAPLMFDQLDVDRAGDSAAVWEKVIRKVRSGAMPPAGMPRPDAPTFRKWVESLEATLDRAAAAAPQVGRPAPVHRLNRAEYANAVRDLLGLEVDARDLLPADDSGYGFDNIGDVLSVSPGLLERYMLAAARISRQALGDRSLKPATTTYKLSPYLIQTDRGSEDLPFGSRGGLAVRHHFPLDGDFVFKVNLEGAAGQQEVELRIDRARVKVFKPGTPGAGGLEVRAPVKAGTRLVGVAFVGTLDRMLPIDGRPTDVPVTSFEFSQSAIDSIQITGPYDGTVPTQTVPRERIFVCQPAGERDEAACSRRIASALARRAYRRPVTETDLRPLIKAYEAGRQRGDFEEGIRWAVEAVLVSPRFLFRVEREPEEAGPLARLDEFELASRLSFFLWSSIPDEQLLRAAEQGRLKDPVVLEQQVRRMLAHTRASALVVNFGGQWLWLRNLRTAAPNADLFPEFDENLREAFQKETELFLEDQLRADRSVAELLTANYTFLNERLARHYGIRSVYGSHFRRVAYPDDRRAGVLGHGSVLTVTAYSNRTSPVVRGKWLLENLLGAPPPPPPPNAPSLRENNEGGPPTPVRERMEQHRSNPVCASCHAQMDPLGFALENFDAVGKWRVVDAEAKTAIDASGTLVDGRKFSGPAEFRRLLFERRSDVVATVTEKLLTYALGRGVEYYDMPVVRQILRDAAAEDYRWSALIVGIAKSLPFQHRQARERPPAP